MPLRDGANADDGRVKDRVERERRFRDGLPLWRAFAVQIGRELVRSRTHLRPQDALRSSGGERRDAA